MNLRTLVPLAAATLLASGTAAAQSADSTPAEPRYANSFVVQVNGNPVIGLWHRVSPSVEAGLEMSARRSTSSTDLTGNTGQSLRFTSVSVGPAVKLFTAPAGALRPYVYGSAGVSFVRNRSESHNSSGDPDVYEQKGHAFDGSLALGLEWHPVERVSIGGHAGVLGSWGTGTVKYVVSDGTVDTNDSVAGTFNSGVRVQFYF
ncbi:MAG TPA: hypothetical protein VFJ16_23275 [Longimicrobium sp.]|nr:hypothetical protein [Longimicrobium sp.]